jgi:hypothetical protein
MNVQGRLTDSTGIPAAAGSYTFTFAIFDQATGGTKVWPGGPGESQVLSVNDLGVWNACVGAVGTLTESVFQSASRWLQITVNDGANPPDTLPRLRLNTSPYSYRTGSAQGADSLSGRSFDDLDSRWVNQDGDVMGGALRWTNGSTPMTFIYESGTTNPGRFITAHSPSLPSWGLEYRDVPDQVHFVGNGTSAFSVALGTGNIVTGEGAFPAVFNSFAPTANSAVALPDNAVSAPETLDEPGIAAELGSNLVDFTSASPAGMIDLLTVSITTPADGYIFLQSSVYAWVEGPAGSNGLIFIQIDDSAGGSKIVPYYRAAGVYDKTSSSSFHMTPCDRVFFKPAGTYTFRIEAEPQGITSSTTVHVVHRSLTALFVPTSYGEVVAPVREVERGEFDSWSRIEVRAGDDGKAGGASSSERMYQVDLRALELKAARAQAAAERARRELLEAQARSGQSAVTGQEPGRREGDR